MNSKVRYELEFCNTIGFHFIRGLILDLPWKIKKKYCNLRIFGNLLHFELNSFPTPM